MMEQVNATYLWVGKRGKGYKQEPRPHYFETSVFCLARDGGDDWVEDRFYKGKKIE